MIYVRGFRFPRGKKLLDETPESFVYLFDM